MSNQPNQENKPSEGGSAGGYVALVLAWAVPGLGHLVMGERIRGLVFAVVIHGLFAAGMLIAGIRAINPPEQQIWTYTQFLTGWPMLVASPIEKNHTAQFKRLIDDLHRTGTIRLPDGRVLTRPPLDDDAAITDRTHFGRTVIEHYPQFAYHPKVQDIGAVYCGIAGMLNLLVMFDVLLRITGSTRESPEKKKKKKGEAAK